MTHDPALLARVMVRSVVMLMLITLRFGGDAALDHVRSGHAGCGWDLLSLSPIRPDDPLAG